MTRSASASSRLRAAMNSSGSPVSPAEHAAGERCGGLPPVLPRPGHLVEAGVVDRGPGRRGQGLGQLFVLGAEPAPGAVGEVEVAEHHLTDPDRDPQEVLHRRVPGREPARAAVVGQGGQSDRVRVIDQRPEQALALRQVPDPGRDLDGHADVHELRQPTARRDHPQRGVAGTDQLPGRLGHVPQHRRQPQITDDELVGPQQTPQPALGAHHLLGPLDQLSQQLVELQPPQPRKHQHLIRWSADPVHPAVAREAERAAAPGEGRGSGRPLPVHIDRPSAPRGEPAFRAVEHGLARRGLGRLQADVATKVALRGGSARLCVTVHSIAISWCSPGRGRARCRRNGSTGARSLGCGDSRDLDRYRRFVINDLPLVTEFAVRGGARRRR